MKTARHFLVRVLCPALLLGLVAGSLPAADDIGLTSPELDNGYLRLGFDKLASYKFVAPPFDPTASSKAVPPTGDDQIPATIKRWSGKKAIVTGFMLPVKMDGGLVTEFLLVKDPMLCCYGVMPNMNEWVVVKMNKGAGVKALMDVPLSFYGELTVGAMYENGYMTGVYLLNGEKMGEIKE
ncbi:MAG: DUF3299 domain-containing protein [Opitutaceae bacterium]